MIETLKPLADHAAVRAGINPALLIAVIEVESSWDIYAQRYEPTYRWLWNVETGKPYRLSPAKAVRYAKNRSLYPVDFPGGLSEFDSQRTSYGLMQIMGAVARELGFASRLIDLYQPEINLFYGCKLLSKLINKHGERGALRAYNTGSAKSSVMGNKYLDKVLKAMRKGS